MRFLLQSKDCAVRSLIYNAPESKNERHVSVIKKVLADLENDPNWENLNAVALILSVFDGKYGYVLDIVKAVKDNPRLFHQGVRKVTEIVNELQ